jgi:putative transposase
MRYDPDRRHRSSIRLKDHDYSREGAYFVTICTHQRECLLGEIADREMKLNPVGVIFRDEWLRSAQIRKEIRLDVFVVMPNHIHGIVVLLNDRPHFIGVTDNRPILRRQRATAGRPYLDYQPEHPLPPPTTGLRKRSISSFIGGFKSACTRSMNQRLGSSGIPLWQRNYYEHIIRSENSLRAVREYIQANPMRWAHDMDNPDFVGKKARLIDVLRQNVEQTGS